MARASVAWTLQLSTVRRVTAERLEGARTSNRMLEKVGVARVGRRMDDEDPLLLCEQRSSVECSTSGCLWPLFKAALPSHGP